MSLPPSASELHRTVRQIHTRLQRVLAIPRLPRRARELIEAARDDAAKLLPRD